MEIDEREQWIEEKIVEFHVNNVGKLLHAQTLYSEMIQAYIQDLLWATILYAEAALNSLLSQKLGKSPGLTKQGAKKSEEKRKPSDYKMPSTSEMIAEAAFISENLERELFGFLNRRHKVIHPKT
jgi:hypothetical protein